MLKKQIFHWVQKKCNAKQYDTAIPISWGSHSRTHTHDMDNKSHHNSKNNLRVFTNNREEREVEETEFLI